MDIVKSTRSLKTTREEMEAVNALARRELGEEELYLFSVRLCDNEVDRDGERFSTQTLEDMCPMFVGKSGIFDHQWSAKEQTARLYKCEVVYEPQRLTQAGEGYCWLKGCAYMLRSQANQDLIAQIDAGIKKEVSVGCSVERKVCSICGEDVTHHSCQHKKGERYSGELCYVTLEGAVDAYEFSFVAVPAQPGAGVVKGLDQGCASLKELVYRNPQYEGELERLEEEAALGRKYLKELKDDVVRLGLMAQLGLDSRQLRDMADTLYPAQLELLKQAYGRKAREKCPVQPRLDLGNEETRHIDEAFVI